MGCTPAALRPALTGIGRRSTDRWKEKMKLGDVATDSITGFTGVVVARCEYLTGCTQWRLQPKGLQDGKIIQGEWFDEMRVAVVNPSAGGPVGSMPKPQHP